MPLAGTFDVLDLADVLDLLARGSRTGRLQVRGGAVHAALLLSDGAVVGADGSAGTGGPSSRNTRSLVDDICFEVLRAGRGSFEFHPDADVRSAGQPVKVSTALSAAKRRLAEWRDVEAVIPSFDATPRLADRLGIDTVTVSQEQWRVLVALDGRRSIAALARRLDVDPLRICKLLKPLVQDGAVILEDVDAKVNALPVVAIPPIPENGEDSVVLNVRVAGAHPALTVPVVGADCAAESGPEEAVGPVGSGRSRPRLVHLRRQGRVAPTG